VQAHQACGLRGQAVGGNQLLLLADRAGEAERVRAEADQPDRRDQRQAQRGGARNAQALARLAGGYQQERQRQPGGDLDRDPRDQRGGAGAKARAGAGREQQCGGERQQQQRVVVVAADRQLEQHRVQADEGSGEAPRVPLLPACAAHQRDRGEARGNRERLQRPQTACEPERDDRVAREREQGTVGRALERPAHEQVDRVGGRLGGDVRIRVHPLQGAEAGEVEIAEDVLGDQRRPDQQREVRGDDRRPDHPTGQHAHGEQHRQIARGHDQRERLEVAGAEAHAEPRERASQPAWPAPAARGNVL